MCPFGSEPRRRKAAALEGPAPAPGVRPIRGVAPSAGAAQEHRTVRQLVWPGDLGHTFEVCIAVLTVAWLAVDLGRPDLMQSKSRLLAPC